MEEVKDIRVSNEEQNDEKEIAHDWILLYFTLMSPTLTTFQWIAIVLLLLPTLYAMMKGAPFVPTPMEQVRRMLKAAALKPGDTVYDLGSGDGRLVHTAARLYEARAIGYELSPLVWAWSLFLRLFWRSKGELRFGNFWTQDLSDAKVIVCYLLPLTMAEVKLRLLPQLKPGTLLVSHAFQIPGWKPYKVLERDNERKLAAVWIYKIGQEKSAPKNKARPSSSKRS